MLNIRPQYTLHCTAQPPPTCDRVIDSLYLYLCILHLLCTLFIYSLVVLSLFFFFFWFFVRSCLLHFIPLSTLLKLLLPETTASSQETEQNKEQGKMSQHEQYWLPGYELSRQVILSNIHIFLGPTASARPYTYHVWNLQPFTNGYITLPFSTIPDTVILGPRWIPSHWKQTHPSTSCPSLPAGAAYLWTDLPNDVTAATNRRPEEYV